ncbi:MAG: FAD-binding oxidoreductase [Bacteroidales bacterium]|nr:FAD-binding oxidoreductase [Bacteroidales bacterium]
MINGVYKKFVERISKVIPSDRILHDELSLLAFGTDASFYRILPKVVVKARKEEDIVAVLAAADALDIAVTFRAAGTSLSGQAIGDSVLVLVSHGWDKYQILNDAKQIRLQVGIRGIRANQYLAKYGRKIGPDPASTDSAMIGGIIANNASGMSCGTHENSYRTIADARIILADGTILDTGDKESVMSFKKTHKDMLDKLENISRKISANPALKEKIVKKHSIKNTSGYGLNTFVDYSDGIDIIKHIIVGSEGTLAFLSDVTLNTVINPQFKATSLIIFPSIQIACEAVQVLRHEPVAAVELLDRQSLKSVESAPGVPPFIKGLPEGCCALLVETHTQTEEELTRNVDEITESIKHIETTLPFIFTRDLKEIAAFWKIRQEALPTVAGLRKTGTTAVIEDVCFPVDSLAKAVADLREVLHRNHYDDAGIFGHALAGNLHFMFNQDFQTPSEVERFHKFMDEIAEVVVDKYDSSMKAEHGTGRNIAPYVRKEWGDEAYAIMKEVKEIFDPKGILNPGVILNEDPKIHVSNLKPNPATHELVDKCMECGFCESKCVAEGLTLSPRQRVAVYREIKSLKNSGQEPHRAAELQKNYQYYGLDTCATDSLCAMRCPVKVDTGKMVKVLRDAGHSKRSESVAMFLANHIKGITCFGRFGMNILYYIRLILGKRLFGAIAHGLRTITFGAIPLWTEPFPKGNRHSTFSKPVTKISDDESNNIVYFPSCITRTMGTAKSYSHEVELTELTKRLLTKAGYNIIYPKNLDKLCCGMAFSSKGFVDAGKKLSDELEAALLEASNGGKYPVLCDMSPCLYTMHANMDGGPLKLYEPAEFAEKYLLPRLKINKVDEKVAIFAVCSAKKLGVDQTLANIARACVSEVTVVDSNCCGFAGDRGFLLPELNKHGLRYLKEQVYGCESGYATSRTCEIGLSYHSGLEFKSILYLLDRCSE